MFVFIHNHHQHCHQHHHAIDKLAALDGCWVIIRQVHLNLFFCNLTLISLSLLAHHSINLTTPLDTTKIHLGRMSHSPTVLENFSRSSQEVLKEMKN